MAQTQQLPLSDAPVTLADVVSPKRAAELMGVSLRAVYHWIEKRQVEVRYSPGGRVYIVEASLLQRAPGALVPVSDAAGEEWPA